MAQSPGQIVNRLSSNLIFAVALVGSLSLGDVAIAGPLDFLRAIGDTIVHGHERHQARQKKAQRNPSRNQPKNAADQQQPANQGAPQPSPAGSAAATGAASPAQTPVRAASSVSQTTGRDIPYGIPVPGRDGFVTSPWSPNQGYVDVRGFPSGTEVKDPYTGKVFLTP